MFRITNEIKISLLIELGEKNVCKRFSMWLVGRMVAFFGFSEQGVPVERQCVRALSISDVISFAGQWRTLMSITVECKECSQP